MTPSRWRRDLGDRDAYEILGVSPTATAGEIRKARRSRLAAAHPDAGVSSDRLAKLITSAAAILLDPTDRRDYDRWRAGGTPIGRPAPGPGAGPSPMYGSPHVVPHLGQAPPQYYHQPRAPRSRAGLIMLATVGGILLLCLGMCLLNALLLH